MPSKQALSLYPPPCFVLILLGLFWGPSSAQAVEFSPLKGQGVLGQSLQVQAELNNLSESMQDQLRSTCMSASFRGSSTAVAGAGTARAVPMVVDFTSTSKGRGLVRLKSKERLLEPVGDVRLVSECPLVVFDVSWPVLLDPASEPERLYVASREPQALDTGRDFSFSSSDSLVRTFKEGRGQTPSGAVSRVRAQVVAVAPNVSVAVAPSPSVAPATKPELSAEPLPTQVPLSTQEKPDELAMLDQKLMDVNLIQSRPSEGDLNSDSMSRVSPKEPVNSIQIDQIPIVIGSTVTVLMALLLGFWHLQKRRNQSVPQFGRVHEKTNDEISQRTIVEPTLGSSERQFEGAALPDAEEPSPDATNPLLIASFLGADQNQGDTEDLEAEAAVINSPFSFGSDQQSLSAALSLVNRADAKPWVLPTVYQSLVEERNKVLLWSSELPARLLRSQIGLVELAFQEAKRGRSLEKVTMLEFVDAMLQGYELTNTQPGDQGVPDVVKSYLSAKFCEVSGGQAKALLKGNCLALAMVADNYPVCFSSAEWAAWVNESCVGT